MIEFDREYEKIESYSKKNNSIEEEMYKIIQEANIFVNEKQAYLQQYKIDDEQG